MATNDILPIASSAGANVLTQEEYEALTAVLTNGFSSGVLPSTHLNKVLRQISLISAGVAQFMADNQSNNITDSLTTANVSDYLAQAVLAQSTIKAYSIAALPTTNIGPVMVIEAAEVWLWSESAYFEGYRSPLCGRPIFGHTVTPLISEADAVGGTLSKTAYAAMWGYAQENGLVVASGSWVAGTHNFVDVDAGNFRVPDLRNQFLRMTGTDADTANARTLGSKQIDEIKSHDHVEQCCNQYQSLGGNFVSGTSANQGLHTGTYTTMPTGGSETRPVNTAFHPRIHV